MLISNLAKDMESSWKMFRPCWSATWPRTQRGSPLCHISSWIGLVWPAYLAHRYSYELWPAIVHPFQKQNLYKPVFLILYRHTQYSIRLPWSYSIHTDAVDSNSLYHFICKSLSYKLANCRYLVPAFSTNWGTYSILRVCITVCLPACRSL